MDTPAKIAVIGAGPMGLESALYARYLGYDVEIYDRGGVAEHVRQWGHVRMFSPFRLNTSSLGLRAIDAQDENYAPPDPEALLTGHEWADRYLLPLAQSDLLADHLRLQTKVVAISRRDYLKQDAPGSASRGDSPFRLLTRDSQGRESESEADIVIDASGVFGHPNWMGPGGAPAIGECSLRAKIRYDLPDILGKDRNRYADRRVLVVGAGHSAATNVVALHELAGTHRDTRTTWLIRRPKGEGDAGPLCLLAGDPLRERAELVRAANQIAADPANTVTLLKNAVYRVSWDEQQDHFLVELAEAPGSPRVFDEIIANVGFRPDNSIYAELQIHECYVSGGPMKLAARLLEHATADCLRQPSHGPGSLMNPEPNFYILGAKSFGRNTNFLVALGLRQIRDLFQIIGDRETLNLYE